jgi:hypothetical protein
LLTGTLDHLGEVDLGPDVSIEVGLSARLINLKTGDLLWQGAASRKVKLDQHSVPAIVAEISREVEIVVGDLVSSMQDHVSTASLSLSGSNTQQ